VLSDEGGAGSSFGVLLTHVNPVATVFVVKLDPAPAHSLRRKSTRGAPVSDPEAHTEYPGVSELLTVET
jgi:hypothetical protein